MKITIESTQQVTTFTNGARGDIPGRVWVGVTESGIPVQCVITRIAVESDERQDEFLRELSAQHAPAPEPAAFSFRMVL